MRALEIYIDGAAKGNPGPAGVGIIICDANGYVLKNISEFIGEATNNVAEYNSLIYALKEASALKADKIKVLTDSELLYKQLKGEYRVRHANLKPLFEQARRLLSGFSDFEIKHIGREHNRGADKLASQGALKLPVS